jgi:hypothetical protein
MVLNIDVNPPLRKVEPNIVNMVLNIDVNPPLRKVEPNIENMMLNIDVNMVLNIIYFIKNTEETIEKFCMFICVKM